MSGVLFKLGQALQAGGRVVLRDATTVPQESPLAIDTTGVTIVIPTNAVVIVMSTLQQSVKLAVDSGYANGYALLAGGVEHRIPCADGQPLYIKTESGTDSLSFYFEIA